MMVENAVFLTSLIIVYKELYVQHMILKQQFAHEQLKFCDKNTAVLLALKSFKHHGARSYFGEDQLNKLNR